MNRATLLLLASLTCACAADEDEGVETEVDAASPAIPDAAPSSAPDTAVPPATPDAAVPPATPDAAPPSAPDAAPPSAPDAAALPPIGGERAPRVVLPSTWSAESQWPLVILLHGYRANGTLVDSQFGISREVEAQQFVLLVPEGLRDPDGFQRWNLGATSDTAPDDVAYLRSLIGEATERYNIDPARVFVTGHSNGGGMVYRLACEASDVVTGIGALSATNDLLPASCPDARPVALLHLHGDLDGAHAFDDTAEHPGVDGAIRGYTSHLGCTEPPATEDRQDFENVVPGAETEILTWSGCQGGVGVQRWRLFGVGHIPILTPAGSGRLVRELLSMRRE